MFIHYLPGKHKLRNNEEYLWCLFYFGSMFLTSLALPVPSFFLLPDMGTENEDGCETLQQRRRTPSVHIRCSSMEFVNDGDNDQTTCRAGQRVLSYSFLRPPIQQIEDSQVKINDELNICRWWLLHDHRKVINMGWIIGEDKGRQDEVQWCGDNAVHLVPRNGRWSSWWYFDLIRGIQRKSIDKWRFYVAWFVTVATADASLWSLKSVSSSYADHS